MAIRPFLAMTAAEIFAVSQFPSEIGWMACHFSPYGLGLSNLPRQLPPKSLLILDDITPIHGHDPLLIAHQLAQRITTLDCAALLLDFQRPEVEETAALVSVLAQGLPCPVAVSHLYADAGACPVFLPPVPPSVPPEAYFAPWQGRELWLELALDGEEIILREDGAVSSTLPHVPVKETDFFDETLLCHYRCELEDDAARFTLYRTEADLELLLAEAEKYGVTTAVGLYQELSSP